MREIADEDEVLTVLERHGGELRQRLRTDVVNVAPLEIHVIRFSNDEAYENYSNDERTKVVSPANALGAVLALVLRRVTMKDRPSAQCPVTIWHRPS